MDTPRIAFAPSLPLFSVPSSSISVRSMSICSRESSPQISPAMVVFTFSTAVRTPLPRYRFLSPSRSSTASYSPVEAPDGTAARPSVPSSSTTSTSIVGFPRESSISRASIYSIMLIEILLLNRHVLNDIDNIIIRQDLEGFLGFSGFQVWIFVVKANGFN